MSNRRKSKRPGTAVVLPNVPVPKPVHERDPSSKCRSEWALDVENTQRLAGLAADAMRKSGVVNMLEPDITAWTRNVGDGRLDAYIGTVPSEGIHMSIAHKRRTKDGWRPGRYPSWDEIADARERLLPADREFAMVLPKPEDYVAVHPTTFHLWEVQPRGVVKWGDGTLWNVEIAQLPNGNLDVDKDGYPVGRLTPYAVQPVNGGEGDVTAPPDAPTEASSGLGD